MTAPARRRRWALPWPPDCEPPPGEDPLWMGSCDRCAGAGTVAAAELGANPGSAPYTCPSCGGSGVNETHARRPMP